MLGAMSSMARWEAEVTPGRLRVAAALVLAANLIVSAAWLLTSRGLVDRFGQPLGGDFILFHAVSHVTLAGRPADAFSAAGVLDAQRAALPAMTAGLRWFYPPTFQLLLAPLALLPFAAAYATWTALGVGLLAAVLRGVLGRLPLWPLLALPAVLVTAWQGQTSFLVASALGFGLFQLDRRPLLAGAVLGLLVCKPQFAVLPPLLLAATGRWRPLAAAAASAALLTAASTLAFGPELWRLFLAGLPAQSRELAQGGLPWTKVISLYVALIRLGVPQGVALALHGAVALLVAAATVRAWRRPGPLGPKAGAAAIAALVVTPYGFNYDLVILAPLLAAAVAQAARGPLRPGVITALAPLAVLPSLMVALAGTGVQTAPLFLLVGVWGALRLCGGEARPGPAALQAPAPGAA